MLVEYDRTGRFSQNQEKLEGLDMFLNIGRHLVKDTPIICLNKSEYRRAGYNAEILVLFVCPRGRAQSIMKGAAQILTGHLELHGDMRPRLRRAAIEQLTTTSADTARVVLATGRYIGEGFDDSRLDTLLLAMPIAWKGTVVQYAGCLHRPHPGKHDALVYDYVDTELPVLRRMFAKRLKTYQALGYTLE